MRLLLIYCAVKIVIGTYSVNVKYKTIYIQLAARLHLYTVYIIVTSPANTGQLLLATEP